ncbi:hypothetical protein [Sphingobacterium faecium]|uniref:hypothetical protein n=1 Tax=Sphingobacterium faecium TaxID=34087 RepID=UPI003207DF2D
MSEEWSFLARRYKEAGAREKFEDICESLYKKKYPGYNVKGVRVVVGDGGIDIFIGNLGVDPVIVVQCKFFLNGIGQSQESQIRESFKTVVKSNDFTCSKWILCIPAKLSIREHKWWTAWKTKQEKQYGEHFIELHDGADLIDDLRTFDLYDTVFEEHVKNKISEIHNLLINPKVDVDSEFLSASTHLANLKNYFSDKSETHIIRTETKNIVEWVRSDLAGKSPEEKILIVKGKKGIGKSTILKDTYLILKDSDNMLVLGIKCDQYYGKNIRDLYIVLFQTISSLHELERCIASSEKHCVILLDQLDALSQTLSSDRSYLSTYVRFIDELMSLKDTRIIISSRSYDLQYDAELKRYNDSNFITKISVDHLLEEDVRSTLRTLKIENVSERLVSLLTIPYNLELFTKIPDVNKLFRKNRSVTISKIYDELWKQVLSNKDFRITECLDFIVNQMYDITPNLVSETFLSRYIKEVDYLLSHNILVKNLGKLSFFHQSFYEYYLARWFVSSDVNLIEYIFEEDQSLYVRSLVKTVIEYLRESNHQKYISLYKEILTDDKIRFHIKYLFIIQLGCVEVPSKKEQILIVDVVLPTFNALFLEVVDSKGWLDFLLANDFLSGEEGEIYSMTYRNVNYDSNAVLRYIERSNRANKNEIIKSLIPNIENWDNELLPFFDKYYPYSQQTELWYFNTLKKIARSHLEFTFQKLRPIVLKERNKNERIRFDHRYDKLIDVLYKIDSKATCEFLLSIQLDVLESTKYPYFEYYHKIISPLFNSYIYKSQIRYIDSFDEKSLDHYLIKFYKDCDIECFKAFFNKYKTSDLVPILTIIAKILKDRKGKPTTQIVELLVLIDSKNGFIGPDDFFQLSVRRLIANTIHLLNNDQYIVVTGIINKISHPYEIYIGVKNNKKVYSLNIGRKKYLFIKSLPKEIFRRDKKLWIELKMLERRFGDLDPNKSLDESSSREGITRAPLPNFNYSKLTDIGWLVSMKTIDENFQPKDFLAGGLVEHARAFENKVSQRPEDFYPLIEQLFSENVSQAYISYGIAGLIKSKFDPRKVSNLIHRFITLELIPEYRLYTIWNLNYLFKNGLISDAIVDFLVLSIGATYNNSIGVENPNRNYTVSTPTAICDKLFSLTEFSQYEEQIFSTIEFLVDYPGEVEDDVLCLIMAELSYLNQWNIERSFNIFKKLVSYKKESVLKSSSNSAQYFNHKFHNQMQFYFDEVLKNPNLHEHCYVFVSSWLFESISDFAIYDSFLKLGGDAANCALTVAEEFLINDEGINFRALDVIEHCLSFDCDDISYRISSIVLRKFEIKYFQDLSIFIQKYISSIHFGRDPSYLLSYLTECSAAYPLECLDLIDEMIIPENVDISKRGYLDDEPLTLILAIYSKLQQGQLKYRNERRRALDIFDRMLALPAIRQKATNALEEVLH